MTNSETGNLARSPSPSQGTVFSRFLAGISLSRPTVKRVSLREELTNSETGGSGTFWTLIPTLIPDLFSVLRKPVSGTGVTNSTTIF